MNWALALDLLGTFFFAISGSLLAAQRGYDIVGSLLLGSLTGLGGTPMMRSRMTPPPQSPLRCWCSSWPTASRGTPGRC
jgi:hypothetical protein